MKIDRITITGADDRTNHEDMLALSERYPFVEWGILVSASRYGEPRFPTAAWIERAQLLGDAGALSLSLHVCGRWVRDMLTGRTTMPYNLVSGFQRIQLNFHGWDAPCDTDGLAGAICYYGDRAPFIPGRQVIFQIDANKGMGYLAGAVAAGVSNVAPLFDASGGAGRVPDEWPLPFVYRHDEPLYFGYAGGLGPQNLALHIGMIAGRIGQVSGDTLIWLDMETMVRSDDAKTLDMNKVEYCLATAKRLAKDYQFGAGALA